MYCIYQNVVLLTPVVAEFERILFSVSMEISCHGDSRSGCLIRVSSIHRRTHDSEGMTRPEAVTVSANIYEDTRQTLISLEFR